MRNRVLVLTLFFAIAVGWTPCSIIADDSRFVSEGVAKDVRFVGSQWKTDSGTLVGGGAGNILYAGKQIGPGDFTISRDGGETWGKAYLDDALETPVCQANMLRYSWPEGETRGSKSHILFSSPRGSSRSNLTVWLSYNEGKTWPVSKQVYIGGSAYSDLVALPDGRVGVLHEKDGYQTISLATFDLSWLEGE